MAAPSRGRHWRFRLPPHLIVSIRIHDELDNFEEAYCGEWDSEEDFARHIISESYNLESEMGDLARYFDYEAFGRELFMYDYSMGANNHVFRNI